MPLSRRKLASLAALGLLGWSGCRRATPDQSGAAELQPPVDGGTAPPAVADLGAPVDTLAFAHGVASGDPLADGVVLWTRVSCLDGSEPESVALVWVVARDPELGTIVASGEVVATRERDYTAKVEVDGLEPGSSYYYRFLPAAPSEAVRGGSPLGRTRTLPGDAAERVRLAVASCSNYPQGFFNAYAAIARRAELDLVLHLGDYIYEYEEGRYGDGREIGRPVDPPGELLSLEDYRRRYACYRGDMDLQELHRQHPMVAVWDDHESANDAWTGGAQNHQDAEGDWQARKAAALQAYFEWMPIREGPPQAPQRSYRRLRLGQLADLIMLDTRLVGRDQQVDADDEAGRLDPERSLLGSEQERWLGEQLRGSQADGVAWRLLGQQVMLAQLLGEDGRPDSLDSWDGYPAARARLLDELATAQIDNVAVLTGDSHSSWAFEVGRDPWAKGPEAEPQLVELGTPAISSPGPVPPERAEAIAEQLLARHPHLRWCELRRRGYLLVDVTKPRLEAQWWHVDTVRERRADEALAAVFAVERGSPRLKPAEATASPPGPALAPKLAQIPLLGTLEPGSI